MIENNRLWAPWKVKDNEYRLKLKTSEIERLERAYGIGSIMNPIVGASEGQLPALSYMLDVLHAAFQKYHHGYSRSEVTDLYDEYLDDGGSQTELMKLVIEIFKASGFFPKERTRREEPKN